MEKYLFILGRNWRLALAEIDSYLQTPTYAGKIVDYSGNVAIVEFETPDMNEDLIGELMIRLGSVQKIGKMLDFIEDEIFKQAFPVEIEENRAGVFSGRRYLDNTLKDIVFELFPDIKDKKFFVANSIYPITFNSDYYEILVKFFLHYVNKFFNTYLKEQGAKKAIYYKYPQKNIESGNLNPIFPHHFFTYELYKPNRVEILYCLTDQGMYVGKTITVADSNFQKQMDEDRPFKDFRQTIPPKFAKTLISFLGLTPPLKSRKIYDPFCGSGTILQFGYMMGYAVYGSDIDEESVKFARGNIKFTAALLQQKNPLKNLNKQIVQADINHVDEKFPLKFFDGVVSEPVLLPYYKSSPDIIEVRKIFDDEVIPKYQELLQKSFDLLKPGCRLGVVAPIVLTMQKRKITIPLPEMAEKVGFKTIQLLNPTRFDEKEDRKLKLNRYGQKSLFDSGTERVSREFYIFQKPS